MGSAMENEDFLCLLESLCDGTAGAQEIERLESHVIHDLDARTLLCRYLNMHAGMRQISMSSQDIATDEIIAEPAQDQSGHASIRTFIISHLVGRAIAACMAAAILVGIYLFMFTGEPMVEPDEVVGPPVATLIGATETVIYEDDIAHSGSEYGSGAYSIDSGEAEFLLRSSVGVTLHGQSRLVMHNPMFASLEHGSARFNCPPKAKGFAVNLPGGVRVVDLGTTFTIRINDAGNAIVQVREGRVRIESRDGNHDLEAGQSKVATSAGAIRSAEPHEMTEFSTATVKSMNPVAYWRFESIENGVVIDETGAHHGKLIGEASLTDSIDGLALDLSGSTAHVSVPVHPALHAPRRELTLSAWVKVADTTDQAIVHNWYDRIGYTLEIHGEKPGFVIATGDTGRRFDHLVGPSPMPTNRWVHIVGVYDGQTMDLYVDGEIAITYTERRPADDVSGGRDELRIGRRQDSDTGHFNGFIDDVAIFNRALSADEVKQIHQAYSTQTPVDNNQNSGTRSESETADR